MSAPRAGARPAARGTGRAGRVPALVLLVGLVALATVGALPPRATAAPGRDSVEVRVDAMSPRVVTADGPGELIVTGRVVNRGAVPVTDLAVRVQRGPAVRSERDARDALEGDEPDEQVRPEFSPVAAVLDPGDEAPFRLRVPLRGPAGSTLGLTEAGVYPLLVNVNGRIGASGATGDDSGASGATGDDSGASGATGDGSGASGATRLGAVRLVLGVLDLPGTGPAPRGDRVAEVGVLYPIADRPRLVPVLPGAVPLLADDGLAASMAPGGRLAGLVEALGRSAPLGSPAAASVCLAVDADLLDTARVMSGGYEVRTPGGPVAGRGARAAEQWLAALREQAAGRCVVALPYADTDVVATSRGNLADLTTAARTTGQRRTAELLGVPPLEATTAPVGGAVDERTVADLITGGTRTLLLDADSLARPTPARGVARLPGPAGGSAAVLALDPLASEALAPRPPSTDGSVSPAGTAAPLAAQDALGMLVLRARQREPAPAAGTRESPVTLVAPPRSWAVGADEAGAYLDAVGDLTGRGVVRPLDVGRLAASAGSGAPLPTTSLARAEVAPGLGDDVVTRARAVRDRQRDLLAASSRDRIGAPVPADLLDPLTEGVMRGLSASRRGDAPAQDAAMAEVEGQMDTLASMVRVVQPAGPYSLGSNDAPLLLSVENRLPVAVNVQVVLDPTPGLRTEPLPVVTVPADGSRQLSVGVEIARSGQFAVDAHAETPGGMPLGPTARLLLRSTVYGTITVWLTASAGVVLVVLASVRITRRVLAARRARRERQGRRRAGHRRGPPSPGPTDPPTRELQAGRGSR